MFMEQSSGTTPKLNAPSLVVPGDQGQSGLAYLHGDSEFDFSSTPWYFKIVCLQYGFSVAVLIDFIYLFQVNENIYRVTVGLHFHVKDYALWFSLNFVMIWGFSLVCGFQRISNVGFF
jgi:hypothetical protein